MAGHSFFAVVRAALAASEGQAANKKEQACEIDEEKKEQKGILTGSCRTIRAGVDWPVMICGRDRRIVLNKE